MKVWEKLLEKDIERISQTWRNFAETGQCSALGIGEIRCGACPFDGDDGICGVGDDAERTAAMRAELNKEVEKEHD